MSCVKGIKNLGEIKVVNAGHVQPPCALPLSHRDELWSSTLNLSCLTFANRETKQADLPSLLGYPNPLQLQLEVIH